MREKLCLATAECLKSRCGGYKGGDDGISTVDGDVGDGDDNADAADDENGRRMNVFLLFAVWHPLHPRAHPKPHRHRPWKRIIIFHV